MAVISGEFKAGSDIFICKKDIFPKTVMQYKIVYATFLMFLVVFKVQCEICSLQINYETYEEYTHCKVNFFIKELWSYAGCMQHCENLGGRAVPVRTPQEWKEMDEVFKDLQNYTSAPDYLYLSVMRGEVDGVTDGDTLSLEHWPKDVREDKQNVWRDYYTGEQLEVHNRTVEEGNSHCAILEKNYLDPPNSPYDWFPLSCAFRSDLVSLNVFCPCRHPMPTCQAGTPCIQRKQLLLRGTCSSSNLRGLLGADIYFSPRHMPTSFDKVFLESRKGWFDNTREPFSRIDYNTTSMRWVHSSKLSKTTAFSLAKEESYILGKYNWTVSNDHQQCHLDMGKDKDQDYSKELKLSGCNQGFRFEELMGGIVLEENGEFTCNDGQCVSMEKRCDQLPDCKDSSDEKGCQLFSLVEGYNNVVSPFARMSYLNDTIVPVSINVSMRLLKMMGIDERENSIDLQFKIILEWRDQRITFNNLKKDSFFNALTEDEMRTIWLPILIYTNTDQKETTRLGWVSEWSTSVIVSRDGNFTR